VCSLAAEKTKKAQRLFGAVFPGCFFVVLFVAPYLRLRANFTVLPHQFDAKR